MSGSVLDCLQQVLIDSSGRLSHAGIGFFVAALVNHATRHDVDISAAMRSPLFAKRAALSLVLVANDLQLDYASAKEGGCE